jgi:hypothetical protein
LQKHGTIAKAIIAIVVRMAVPIIDQLINQHDLKNLIRHKKGTKRIVIE